MPNRPFIGTGLPMGVSPPPPATSKGRNIFHHCQMHTRLVAIVRVNTAARTENAYCACMVSSVSQQLELEQPRRASKEDRKKNAQLTQKIHQREQALRASDDRLADKQAALQLEQEATTQSHDAASGLEEQSRAEQASRQREMRLMEELDQRDKRLHAAEKELTQTREALRAYARNLTSRDPPDKADRSVAAADNAQTTGVVASEGRSVKPGERHEPAPMEHKKNRSKHERPRKPNTPTACRRKRTKTPKDSKRLPVKDAGPDVDNDDMKSTPRSQLWALASAQHSACDFESAGRLYEGVAAADPSRRVVALFHLAVRGIRALNAVPT
eukprot:SAG31_NODE_445_length_15593_cov_8.514974_6_plen_328_part_00